VQNSSTAKEVQQLCDDRWDIPYIEALEVDDNRFKENSNKAGPSADSAACI
jgi:hypothetical protein